MILEDVLERLEKVRPDGDQFIARCPAHDDDTPSLRITEGKDGRILVKCFAGCTHEAIVTALKLEPRDLFPAPAENGKTNGEKKIVATYDYHDERGELLFQVCRFGPVKDFRQRRPDGTWGLGNTRRVIYRLPLVLSAIKAGQTVYIVEGEKDADAIEASREAVATCNPMGAGKWKPEYAAWFTGANVIVVADNDGPGLEHARTIAASLERVATSVEVRRAATGKDVSDHLAAGKKLAALVPVDIADAEVEMAHSWRLTDLLASEVDPPAPPVISGLAYRDEVHIWSGEPESLKSLLALVLAIEQIRDHNTTVYIDFENGPREIAGRLRALGMTDEEMRKFRYFWSPSDRLDDPTVRADIAALLERERPSFIVVDSYISSLALHDFHPNDSMDIEKHKRVVVDLLRSNGAAIVLLDHPVKDAEKRGKYSSGSERKIGIGQIHLAFEVVQPLSRGGHGIIKLRVHKDRPGWLKRDYAAEVRFDSSPPDGANVTWAIRHLGAESTASSPSGFRPTKLMEKVSSYLELQPEPVSRNVVEDNVIGNRQYVRVAMDCLVAENFATEIPGQRGARLLKSEKPFREAEHA